MNWHYKVLGTHTHVRVFVNGANCGKLVFRNEEFIQLYQNYECLCNDAGGSGFVEFIEDGETQPPTGCEATDVSAEPEITLALCESRHLVLRPGIRYRFEVVDDCKECKEIYEEGKLP